MSQLDSETLKIPTFMRRKRVQVSHRQRAATALDRKLIARHRKPRATKPKRVMVRVRKVRIARAVFAPKIVLPKPKRVVKPVRVVKQKPVATKKVIKNVPKKKPVAVMKPKKVVIAPAKKEKPIAIVTHFYDQIKVAVLNVKKPLAVGDTIHIQGNATDFSQKIDSMQINHENVQMAKKGDDVGLKLKKPVRVGDSVYIK